MGDKEEKLWQWVDSVLHYEPISWDRLPELDLYMDQVITLMSKELDPFSLEGERLLTPSMINNYVKDGVLPRPNQKKIRTGASLPSAHDLHPQIRVVSA